MGTTPIIKIPYAEPSDPVANYPATDKAAALAIEAFAQPMGFARATSNQSIPHGVVTDMAVVLDGVSSGVTLEGFALKIATAGMYMITAQAVFTHNAVGGRSMFLRKNGATLMRAVGAVGASTGSMTIQYANRLAVNTLIDVGVYQSSGAALAIDSGSNGCSFQVVRISA